MINFEQLVENILLTEAPTDTLTRYFDDSTELTNLRKFLFEAFDVPTAWPASTTIFDTLASVASRGGTANYARFYAFFPALDFAWYVESKHDKSLKDSSVRPDISSSITALETEFINTCRRSNNIPDPLPSGFNKLDPVCGYKPVSGVGNKEITVVQKNYGCKPGVLGTKALENFIQNKYGLLQAIAHIADMRNQTRTIITRTQLLPIIDKNIRDVFRSSQDYVVGAPKGGLMGAVSNKFSKMSSVNPNAGNIAARNPKQIPTRLGTIQTESIMEMAELIKVYANQFIAPTTTPPTPATTKDIDKVLDTKVEVFTKNSDDTSKAIVAWLMQQANVEPGKKNYAGLQSGMAKIASAATGGVQFGK